MNDGAVFDLVVRNARLLDGRVVHLGVRGGHFRQIDGEHPTGVRAAAQQELDADGALVTPTFVNAHMHLDKVHTLPRAGEQALHNYTSGSMGGALASIVDDARAVKRQYDRSWIIPNVRRALDNAIRFGTTHIQAFVDVDTAAELEGLHAVLAAREEYAERLDIQIVAFPQDGVLRDPGAAELCEEAIRLGADVVGGIPWVESTDRDAQAHVDWACGLAARSGRRVAMLVDDAGDPHLRTTEMLAQGLLDHDLVGRGTACHARALSTYAGSSIGRLTQLAKAAGLGFVSDPHTGPLHLPVREFLDAGLAVALGQDDIEDAYYPFGRHNMLEVAFLGAHLLRFLSGADQVRLVEMVTTRAAAAIGLAGHGIAVGGVADLCIHDATTVVDLLAEHAPPRYVIRRGQVIAETTTTTTLRPARPVATASTPGALTEAPAGSPTQR